VEDLGKQDLNAVYFPDTSRLLEALVREAGEGDVILFMSNGAFDNLPRRLLDRL